MNLAKIISAKALPSFCTSNILVIKSLLKFCKNKNLPLLIETTSNQVNQYGGYTGDKPINFLKKINNLVKIIKFNKKNIFFGGDHLGPLPWKKKRNYVALKKSIELVDLYLDAKYQKIHIDTSIKCSDDKLLTNKEVFLRTKYILNNLKNKELLKKTFLVFGTEVPLSGGNDKKKIKPTTLKKIIDEHKYFSKLLKSEKKKGGGSIKCFGLVVEPGMRFMHRNVTKPDLSNFKLKKLFSKKNKFYFEAHSTDYQKLSTLKKLVKNNFKILKVGPELTYNLFKSFLFMEQIEKKNCIKISNFKKIILDKMYINKDYWKDYFKYIKKNMDRKIINSFFDRTRYYLNEKNVENSIKILEHNINRINQEKIIKLLVQHKKLGKLDQIKRYNFKNFDLVVFYFLNKILVKYYKACNFII